MQDQSCLAGAVRPEQGDALAAPDLEVASEQGLMAVGVSESESVHLERRRAHVTVRATAATVPARRGNANAAAQCAAGTAGSWLSGSEPE